MTGLNQEFQAEVSGGVAARDVHNHAYHTSIQVGPVYGGQNIIGHTGDIHVGSAQMLWHQSSAELRQELGRCMGKLRQLRKELLLNVPCFWLLAGIAGSVWMLSTGAWLKYLGSFWFFAWVIGAVLAPVVWLTVISQRKGRLIAHYARRVEIIDTILQDRSP